MATFVNGDQKMKKIIVWSSAFLLTCAGIASFSWYLWAKPSKLVTCDFQGQLGNNLFQIATTVAVALDHDAKPVFPKQKILRNTNGDLNLEHVLHRLDTRWIKKKWKRHKEQEEYVYHQLPYWNNLKLRGYFNSEKYFAHHRKEIQDLFAPKESIVEEIYQRYGTLLNQHPTVAVHVRTFIPDARDPEIEVNWDFYAKAFRHFPRHTIFLVFSDDPEWVKQKFFCKGDNIHFIEGNPHYIDFYMMSLCDHQIISPNSTFSWWAAWLNRNPEKVVIAPKIWQGLKEHDSIPKDWITI